MSVNKVILVGRLGQNPELRFTPAGAAVANFTLATNESWVDKQGQKQERTEWHRIVVWGKLAELCNQYLAKGRQCYVEGRLQTRQWQDQNNQTRYTTEVQAQTVQFLGGQSASADSQQGSYSGQSQGQGAYYSDPAGGGAPRSGSSAGSMPEEPTFTEDDIPF